MIGIRISGGHELSDHSVLREEEIYFAPLFPLLRVFAPLRETIKSFDVLEHIGLYTFNEEMF